MKQSNKGLSNWLLLLGVVVLAVAPLVLIKGAEFSGADGQAEEAIKEIQPEYKPWFNPLVELPSGEVESLLFSVQAAAGAGVIGYVIGLYKGRSQHQRNKE
ncbi:energy-coupling factor ABC transporter substrate-binding protein [Nostoc commune]|uniref:energy-coupling factor ABC transporter substrate-binding protein n=1 Tax=Nostoc commune TaxID=1178 RepID=UPI0018C5CD96|nr:energy-coupling factor ABC transporter substrate-binding protein [Nostoc commune]MBG1264304.1 energy-coupling factor ABC transporter substrate-binding protein [Nostoc commune BAE]MBG1264339.1 energy-coupling factor ABC transporter substrate-binding protein [Nostoc commune BAE]